MGIYSLRSGAVWKGFIYLLPLLFWSSDALPEHSPAQNETVVDLGYGLHRATVSIEDPAYYNFSNIRYAAPPLGPARFTPPSPPTRNRTVSDGQIAAICPQGLPAWVSVLVELRNGRNFSSEPRIDFSNADPGPLQPGTSEDCLFLDILVPKAVYHSGKPARSRSYGTPKRVGDQTGTPVIIWIHGGGYLFGHKTSYGTGIGLLRQNQAGGDDGVIFVAINYRLGLFGWLSGLSFEANNGTPNAGLLDQRFALEWVQRYIHLFGGDPDRVTVMGQSAGGASILHHLTAYGGERGKVPFERAIVQSPFILPVFGESSEESIYQAALAAANVSSFRELQAVPTTELQMANALIGTRAPYGSFVYGPVVDGDYVPSPPSSLLANRRFDTSVSLMVGHNSAEGFFFSSPFLRNSSDYEEYLKGLLPGAPRDLIDRVSALYPPPRTDDQVSRAALTIGELAITCNVRYLQTALPNSTYSYIFSIPPGWHSTDVPYTFYNGIGAGALNTTIAELLQVYITRYAKTGSPDAVGTPYFPPYSSGGLSLNLNNTGIEPRSDEISTERCAWWREAVYS